MTAVRRQIAPLDSGSDDVFCRLGLDDRKLRSRKRILPDQSRWSYSSCGLLLLVGEPRGHSLTGSDQEESISSVLTGGNCPSSFHSRIATADLSCLWHWAFAPFVYHRLKPVARGMPPLRG